jgi:transposase InsO family protein
LRIGIKQEGFEVGRKHVATLTRRMGIEALYRKLPLSQPHPEHRVFPYRLRGLAIERPNQVWAMDICYIPMRQGLVYLTAVMDWGSRRILAWRLSNSLTTDFCIEAVEEAIARYGRPEVFNTDQGSQFTDGEFVTLLASHGILQSMDGKGCWRDNVFVERFWRSIKYEEVYLHAYDSIAEAKVALGVTSTSTTPGVRIPRCLTGARLIRCTLDHCRSWRRLKPVQRSTYPRRVLCLKKWGHLSLLRDLPVTHGAKVFHEAAENEGITRKRLESKVGVEAARCIVLRVHEHGANSGDLGDLKRPPHGVGDQGTANAPALPVPIDRQAGEQEHGDRIPRNAFGESLWRVLVGDIADHERVIADDHLVDRGDIGLRHVRALAEKCVETDKAVQRLVATVEAARIVRGGQLSDAGFFIHGARINPGRWILSRGVPCADAGVEGRRGRP